MRAAAAAEFLCAAVTDKRTWSSASAMPVARAIDSSVWRVEPIKAPSDGLEVETSAEADAKPPVWRLMGSVDVTRSRLRYLKKSVRPGRLIASGMSVPWGGMGAATSPLSETAGLSAGNHLWTRSLLLDSCTAAYAAWMGVPPPMCQRG